MSPNGMKPTAAALTWMPIRSVAIALVKETPHQLHLLLFGRCERRQFLLGDVPEWDEAHGGRVDVDADHVLGIHPAEVGSDEGPEVPTLGAIALIAEPSHQRGESRRDAPAPPAGPGDRPGEAKPRQRRDDQVKRQGRV